MRSRLRILLRTFLTGRRVIEISDAVVPEYAAETCRISAVVPGDHRLSDSACEVAFTGWMRRRGRSLPERKSPKKGNPYQAFIELYKIRPFLKDPNLRLRLDLIDMEEYRLLNGWSRDKKKGSDRFDRIPLTFVEEVLCGPEGGLHAVHPL